MFGEMAITLLCLSLPSALQSSALMLSKTKATELKSTLIIFLLNWPVDKLSC